MAVPLCRRRGVQMRCLVNLTLVVIFSMLVPTTIGVGAPDGSTPMGSVTTDSGTVSYYGVGLQDNQGLQGDIDAVGKPIQLPKRTVGVFGSDGSMYLIGDLSPETYGSVINIHFSGAENAYIFDFIGADSYSIVYSLNWVECLSNNDTTVYNETVTVINCNPTNLTSPGGVRLPPDFGPYIHPDMCFDPATNTSFGWASSATSLSIYLFSYDIGTSVLSTTAKFDAPSLPKGLEAQITSCAVMNGTEASTTQVMWAMNLCGYHKNQASCTNALYLHDVVGGDVTPLDLPPAPYGQFAVSGVTLFNTGPDRNVYCVVMWETPISIYYSPPCPDIFLVTGPTTSSWKDIYSTPYNVTYSNYFSASCPFEATTLGGSTYANTFTSFYADSERDQDYMMSTVSLPPDGNATVTTRIFHIGMLSYFTNGMGQVA